MGEIMKKFISVLFLSLSFFLVSCGDGSEGQSEIFQGEDFFGSFGPDNKCDRVFSSVPCGNFGY